MKFLEWLKKHPELDKKFEFGPKKTWIARINARWPIIDEIDLCHKQYLQNRANHEKFNGNLVMSWVPGLQGKNLGRALSEYKNSFESWLFDGWKKHLEQNSADEIKRHFLEWIVQSKVYNLTETNS